ncbi:MAG: glucosyltransferase domain-containing protein [Lachnospiraceae bacterium]|nr:glucosyltransferase domain-containing protein [Lachnospiraceae bacterium]
MTDTGEKRRNGICHFLIVFAILFAGYCVFLNQSITSDNVTDYMLGYGTLHSTGLMSFWRFTDDGRFALYLFQFFSWFTQIFHVSKYENQWVLQLLLLLMMTWAVMVEEQIFGRFFRGRTASAAVTAFCILFFLNPMFLELFIYVGYEHGVAILLALYAVKAYLDRRYRRCALFLFLTVINCQMYVEFFLIVLVGALYLQSCRDTRQHDIFREGAGAVAIAGAVSAADLLLIRLAVLTGNIRGEKNVIHVGKSLADRLYNAIVCTKITLVDGFGFFPEWMLAAVILLLFILSAMVMIRRKCTCRQVAGLVLFYVFEILLAAAIYMISDRWATPRISLAFFAALSMFFLVACYQASQAGPLPGRALTVLFAVLAAADIYATHTKTMDVYISNKLDMQVISQTEAEIERYEKKSGIKVKYVAICSSAQVHYYSPLLNMPSTGYAYDRTILYDSWGRVDTLNYLTGRDYTETAVSEDEYRQLFGDKTWDTFIPEEQLIFEGDRLYWALY